MPDRVRIEKSPLEKNNDLLDEYSGYLQIDKLNLDTCLIEQCSVYYNVGVAFANALSERDYAKAELERVKAETDKIVRLQMTTENERITEAQVANRILEDAEYRASNSNYLEWKMIADKWQALKDSFGQRAYALRDLCQLWISNYYADSAVQVETSEARDRLASDARVKLSEARRNRRG